MTYVSQTGRTLQVRRKEHLRALTNADPQTSALAEHALAYHHDIAWNEAKVLDFNPRLNQRCALEAWHICSQPHPMNRESGLLPQVYNLLIRPSVTSDCHLTSLFLSLPLHFTQCCASRVTVFPVIAHLFPNYHPVSCHASVLKPRFCNTSLITDDDRCIVCRNI